MLANSLAEVGVELGQDLILRCGDSFQAFRDVCSQEICSQEFTDDAYTLCNLYKEEFGIQLDNQMNTAEDNAMALMKLLLASRSKMTSLMQSNAKRPLAEYQKSSMYTACDTEIEKEMNLDLVYERYTEDCH